MASLRFWLALACLFPAMAGAQTVIHPQQGAGQPIYPPQPSPAYRYAPVQPSVAPQVPTVVPVQPGQALPPSRIVPGASSPYVYPAPAPLPYAAQPVPGQVVTPIPQAGFPQQMPPQQGLPQGPTTLPPEQLPSPPEQEPVPSITSEAASKEMFVRLRVTDKKLGRTKRFKVPAGRVLQFGTLEIIPNRCVIDSSAKPRPRHAALLEIYEKEAGMTPVQRFSGWIFADDPSLSHLEHPYYDVMVVQCVPRGSEEKKPETDEKKDEASGKKVSAESR